MHEGLIPAYLTAPSILPYSASASAFFIDGEPIQQPRKRDESIQRRVKEAKVNLEWKIALKLKQNMIAKSSVEDKLV